MPARSDCLLGREFRTETVIVLHPEDEAKLTSFWLRSGFGPREAAVKLRAAYGVEPASEEILQELEEIWRNRPDATHAIVILLSSWKRLEGFDREDVVWPAEHEHIVSALAEITGNQFAVDDITQTVEPNGDLRLSMRHRGSLCSFVMESYGTWCNVAGTIAGLNHMLEQLGVPERFIEFYSGGGPGALVTFAQPSKFGPIAGELGIRLESQPDPI
jgi:hypothetical protein